MSFAVTMKHIDILTAMTIRKYNFRNKMMWEVALLATLSERKEKERAIGCQMVIKLPYLILQFVERFLISNIAKIINIICILRM